MRDVTFAWLDIANALKKYPLWAYLGWLEVQQKYRRSVIGPWWITISMAIFILITGWVFSSLFAQDLRVYLPSFTAGFLFWTFFSSTLTEGADLLINHAGFIKQIDLPIPVYFFKHLTKHIIILLHNFFVFLIISVFCCAQLSINNFLFLPGFVLFVLNLSWIGFLIAMLCARYRDMVPILNSCIQVAFFITPISWSANQLNYGSKLIMMNPLLYLIDLVKSPLIGKQPMNSSWYLMSFTAICGLGISLYFYGKKRRVIPFWIG